MSNYFYVRTHNPELDEVPWVRPAELVELELAEPVVLVNGCFDLLHSGHMKVLFAAREKAGDLGTVVCAMDSDDRVRAAKGEGRPVLTWVERATALNYMPIDYLVEFTTDKEFDELVRGLRPTLRVQGADYVDKATRYPWLRKMFVPARGMRTSEIIQRCSAVAGAGV